MEHDIPPQPSPMSPKRERNLAIAGLAMLAVGALVLLISAAVFIQSSQAPTDTSASVSGGGLCNTLGTKACEIGSLNKKTGKECTCVPSPNYLEPGVGTWNCEFNTTACPIAPPSEQGQEGKTCRSSEPKCNAGLACSSSNTCRKLVDTGAACGPDVAVCLVGNLCVSGKCVAQEDKEEDKDGDGSGSGSTSSAAPVSRIRVTTNTGAIPEGGVKVGSGIRVQAVVTNNGETNFTDIRFREKFDIAAAKFVGGHVEYSGASDSKTYNISSKDFNSNGNLNLTNVLGLLDKPQLRPGQKLYFTMNFEALKAGSVAFTSTVNAGSLAKTDSVSVKIAAAPITSSASSAITTVSTTSNGGGVITQPTSTATVTSASGEEPATGENPNTVPVEQTQPSTKPQAQPTAAQGVAAVGMVASLATTVSGAGLFLRFRFALKALGM